MPGDLIDEMVERRPVVVDHVTGQEAECWRPRYSLMIRQDCVAT
jgi:hypothetical protein